MRVLVTGANGQLGHDVVLELLRRGHEAIGSGRAASGAGAPFPYIPMDITEPAQVEEVLEAEKPDAVIHCAAWTAVDAAEEPENIPAVYTANAVGTENLARTCEKLGCKLLYISTDYVFDGQGTEPWQPDGSERRPLSVYGRSKLEGELAVQRHVEKYFIVRIAWAFGPNGKNFVRTMLSLGKIHEILRVVNDQIGTPTYTPDLARLLADMIETEKYGCYHASNEGGYISWAEFAAEIFRLAGMNTKVIPVSTAEYGLSKAKRPFNSRLDKSKLTEKGFERLPPWQDALGRYLKELNEGYGTD